MADTGDSQKIVAGISDEQVLKLEQAAIRIPSTTFEEGTLADYLANHMSDIGLDVEMMEVTHWAKPGKTTRQPIARLRGTGGGPSLMLNGHMDPGVEMSGWSVDPSAAKFGAGGCGEWAPTTTRAASSPPSAPSKRSSARVSVSAATSSSVPWWRTSSAARARAPS